MSHESEQGAHRLAGKHIIIAGAGIAGLALVRGLNRNWTSEYGPKPRITVYERDPRALPPNRGNYSLGLRSDKASLGMQALQKLGLFDEVYSARTQGSELPPLIRDANWNMIAKMKVSPNPPDHLPSTHMRITRNTLRECLIRGVEDDTEMIWDVGCNSAATLKDGRVEVKLSNGETTECDILIAADGASSKLRKCLRPEDGLNYAGAVMIGGNATFPEGKVPEQLQQGHGPLLGGEGHGLVIFHIDETTYVWFVTRREPTPITPVKGDEALKMKDEILAEALSQGKIFAEPFPSLIAHTDPSTLKIMNAQDKPPVVHSKDEFNPNIIFVGDANHAVSPFAGNGANMALRDGVSLAESLCRSSSVASAVDAFDKECTPRCKGALKKSHIVIRVAHSTGWILWFAIWLVQVINGLMLRWNTKFP